MVAKVNPPPLRIPQAILKDPELNGFFSELLVIIRQLWAKAGADLLLDDGTEAVPALAFANDSGLGIYRPAEDTLGITAAGSDVAYFSPDGLQVFNLDPASFVYNNASGNLDSTIATNGQFLIGRTGLEPIIGTITGTVNRVTVSLGSGTITLNLPQDIHTGATPIFSDLTLSSLTAGSFLYSGATSSIDSTAAATNGQVLIGSTGANPVAAAVTGTANQVTVSNGPGSITLSLPQNIAAGSSPTFAGLTLSGLTANSFLYSGTSGALTTTMAPSNGQLLIGSTGAAPIRATLTGTANQITVSNAAGSITLSLPQDIGTGSSPTFGGETLNGNLTLNSAGNEIKIKEGANASLGVATLVAGAVTVNNTLVTASSRIFMTRATTGGTVGHLSYTISAGTSFTINSTSATETSTVNWHIVEPA